MDDSQSEDELQIYPKRRRRNNRRASDEQKEYLVEYMSRNIAFANNSSRTTIKSGDEKKFGREALWRKLAAELNSLPGAYKCVEKWKKCWIDLRINAKAKYKRNRGRKEKGQLNGILKKKSLTYLDETILKTIGNPSKRIRTRRATLVQDKNLPPPEVAPASLEKNKTNKESKVEEVAPASLEKNKKTKEGKVEEVAPASLEKNKRTKESKVEEVIGDLTDIQEDVILKIEILEDTQAENECPEEQVSSNPTVRLDNSEQSTEISDQITDQVNSTQKPVRKQKHSKNDKKILNEIADLKATLFKEFFEYKKKKIEIEQQKMQLEDERMKFEKERFALEKYSITERLKIESQKVDALVSISNAINLLAEKSAVVSVAGNFKEESEAEM